MKLLVAFLGLIPLPCVFGNESAPSNFLGRGKETSYGGATSSYCIIFLITSRQESGNGGRHLQLFFAVQSLQNPYSR